MNQHVDPETLALARLYHWERSAPDRVAFTQPVGAGAVVHITWGDVARQARCMAQHLRDRGIQPGDRVALLSKNTAHWLISDLAIWLAGGVSVPLYPTLAAGTVRQILEHSGAKLLFVGKLDGWEAMRAGVPAGLDCIHHPLSPDSAKRDYPGWDAIVARTEPLRDSPTPSADTLATLMYTSGTTGAPKGVMHTFGNFAWSVTSGLKRVHQINGRARMLSYLPLSHVVERTLVQHGQLATSMHVYFAESLETFTQDMQRARPTVFFSVPRLWVKFQQGVHAKLPPAKLERLLKIPIVAGIVRRKVLKGLGLDACELAAVGAAPMPPALLQWFRRLGLPIVEAYGMTENCAVSHMVPLGQSMPGSVGLPFEGVRCRIDAANGEIQMTSLGVMQGYYREADLTQAAFTADGWLKTGDKGHIDAQGALSITGRVKDLFKTSKGKYVAPAPIEDRLVMHEALEAVCVTGADLAQPIALAMLSELGARRANDAGAAAALKQELGAHLAQINATLDPHERVERLVVMTEAWSVDNDLLTPTFKVKRNRIEERFAARFEQWASARDAVLLLNTAPSRT